MIGSITLTRLTDRIQAIVAYIASAILAGGLTGALLGVIGARLEMFGIGQLTSVIAVCAMLLFALREMGLPLIPIPSRNWAIPATWVNGPPWHQGAVWGAILGTGFLTHQPYPIYHAAMLFALFSSDVLFGSVIGVSFALMRTLPVLRAACSNGSGIRELSLTLFSRIPAVHVASGPILGFAGSALLVYVVAG